MADPQRFKTMQTNVPKRRIGHLFKLISDRLRTAADADLQKHDLTFVQARVLRFLKDSGGAATQKEIEQSLGVAHPTVVGLISRLREKGFVECSVSNEDKRNKVVSATPKAYAVMEAMHGFIDANERRMLRGLSQDEVDELERMLLEILGNLEDKEVD